jgi:hypothetical protein
VGLGSPNTLILGSERRQGGRVNRIKLLDSRGCCALAEKSILKSKREDVLRIAAKYGACNVRVFGSVPRGEVGPESDVDLLIDLEPGRSLL